MDTKNQKFIHIQGYSITLNVKLHISSYASNQLVRSTFNEHIHTYVYMNVYAKYISIELHLLLNEKRNQNKPPLVKATNYKTKRPR